ncbi:hypothetical protein RJT34_27035 [Clitoria ternatea]|uniref:Uncharacterized protein n=1 Tax=Clitoria ternatea TaxID=43366 RepID=A0AAN9F7U0_CLITE
MVDYKGFKSVKSFFEYTFICFYQINVTIYKIIGTVLSLTIKFFQTEFDSASFDCRCPSGCIAISLFQLRLIFPVETVCINCHFQSACLALHSMMTISCHYQSLLGYFFS